MLAKVDQKKVADAGMAALVAGLKGAKAVLDTTSIPGASTVFSVILSCIDEAQVGHNPKLTIMCAADYRVAGRKRPETRTS